MSESSQKTKETQYHVKVQDFVNILQVLEKLYQSPLGMNPYVTSFIKKLKSILSRYKELREDEFFAILKTSLSAYESKKIGIKRRGTSKYVDVEGITFQELRTVFSERSLSKEQLLLIGEKRFGLSKGAHRKLKKEQLQDLIESAMENVETLHIIKNKASE